MHREEIEQELKCLSRQDLMAHASELKIVGLSRMRKRGLIESILVARMNALLHEPSEVVRELTRKDLMWMCQRDGIRVKSRSTKQELTHAIRAANILKTPSESPESSRSRHGEGTNIKESRFQMVEAAYDFPVEREDLPESYNETRVVGLPVDPYLVHVYWEVTARDIEEAENLLEDDLSRAQPVLRFYDVTGMLPAGARAHSPFDVDVDLGARNWYVHLWSPGRSYRVELGYRTLEGRFVTLAQSNVARTPRAQPSEKAEEVYMRVSEDTQDIEILMQAMGKEGSRHDDAPCADARGNAGLPPTPGDERPLAENSSSETDSRRIRFWQGLSQDRSPHLEEKTGPGKPLRSDCLDLNELVEQKFICGLSSGSKGR